MNRKLLMVVVGVMMMVMVLFSMTIKLILDKG